MEKWDSLICETCGNKLIPHKEIRGAFKRNQLILLKFGANNMITDKKSGSGYGYGSGSSSGSGSGSG